MATDRDVFRRKGPGILTCSFEPVSYDDDSTRDATCDYNRRKKKETDIFTNFDAIYVFVKQIRNLVRNLAHKWLCNPGAQMKIFNLM